MTEDNRLQAATRFWQLRDRLLAGENIRLMCWCAPKRCHAHTIAHALAHVSAGAVFLRGEVADGDVDHGDDQPLAERPNSPAALLKVVGCTLLRGFATSRMLEIITETCQMEYCMGWNPNPLVGTQDDWMREQMMLSAKHGLAFEGLLALGESALNALGISAPRPKHASLIVTRLGAGPQRWHTDADCADTYSIMVAISSRRVRFEGGIEADLSPGDVLVFDARKRHAGTELVDEHRAIDMPNVGAVALAAHIHAGAGHQLRHVHNSYGVGEPAVEQPTLMLSTDGQPGVAPEDSTVLIPVAWCGGQASDARVLLPADGTSLLGMPNTATVRNKRRETAVESATGLIRRCRRRPAFWRARSQRRRRRRRKARARPSA